MGNIPTLATFWQQGDVALRHNGRRPRLARTAAAWAVAIEGHRADAHGGQRQEGCAACVDLERKEAAARAQNGKQIV